ncbi:sugar fermentation stimulation protein SfsA [Leptolyngbya sp. 'hensonii']|uniref:DNA/RNA nuclease SfsA n=1 Tax=Leptolyngbya sp. 'hensonii' TaxID=1922337 RepID=UPI00094FFB4B|nr:DNA/RNA nuclease SfsA [Leptolyngbya sp. 'hensonii']OLP19571.1 sugar fermentation stimulation protein SfsA [Leptolyngbya sp. 'hensonii']
MPQLVYEYPPLLPGILIKRYKRFLADVELASGEIVTAHCPNTGPMTGVCLPGNPVQISVSDNPNRKLPYTWEMIQVTTANPPIWVGVNTALPNRIVKRMLDQHLLPGLEPYSQVRMEVPYGQDKASRIDFLLTGEEADRPLYVEVKNTTWPQGDLALFPDTVTTRGQKHLQELTALVPTTRAVMLYFINRSDCPRFAPGDAADRRYGELFRAAIKAGVEVLPCRFDVTPIGVFYLGLADLLLTMPIQ